MFPVGGAISSTINCIVVFKYSKVVTSCFAGFRVCSKSKMIDFYADFLHVWM